METVIHSDSDFATVAYLRIKEATLQPKAASHHQEVVVPPLLAEPFSDIRDLLEASAHSTNPGCQSIQTHPPFPPRSHRRIGNWVAVANVQQEFKDRHEALSVEDEVRECFKQLQGTDDRQLRLRRRHH